MHFDSTKPLVSIGIPTFNRARRLARALESALAQNYDRIEIVVSDNASNDETSDVCAAICKKDARVRYVRQPTNCGMTENFRRVLAAAHGTFFMWLSDDDWLDPSYVSQCVRFLSANENYVLACGTARYYEGNRLVREGRNIDLMEDSPAARVLAYYRKVNIDSVFFGIARLDLLAGLEVKQLLGGDWLLSAGLAYRGKIKTLPSTFIHRSITGGSQDLERLALSMGWSNFWARNAHFAVAADTFNNIAWTSPSYSSTGRLSRISLAARASSIVIRRFYLPRLKQRVRDRTRGVHRLLDRHILWRFRR